MGLPFVDDLTPRQFEIAEFIANFRNERDGLSPSYAEIADAVGLSHRSNVRGQLQQLARKGYVEQSAGVQRSVKTTKKWELRRRRKFGMAANPLVMQVVLEHPEDFEGWKAEQFDSLLSRRAFGGELTAEGVLAEARRMTENESAVEELRALLEVEDARGEILELLAALKERHSPRRRKRENRGQRSEVREQRTVEGSGSSDRRSEY